MSAATEGEVVGVVEAAAVEVVEATSTMIAASSGIVAGVAAVGALAACPEARGGSRALRRVQGRRLPLEAIPLPLVVA